MGPFGARTWQRSNNICGPGDDRIVLTSFITCMLFIKPRRNGSLRIFSRVPLWMLLPLAVILPTMLLAGNSSHSAPGRFRIISARSLSKSPAQQPAPTDSQKGAIFVGTFSAPPLEGPILTVAVAVTDERDAELELLATAYAGLTGAPLPGATTNVVFGLLDAGASPNLRRRRARQLAGDLLQ